MKNFFTFNPYKTYKSLWTIVAVILAILFFMSPFFSIPIAKAVTDATVYSNVLDDLKTDPTFDASLFPDNADDYSLQIITIAESAKSELFIYVYNPSDEFHDFTASFINMSIKDPDTKIDYNAGESLEFHLYPLELVSTEGVFDKYIVHDWEEIFKTFVTPLESIRYYNIASILREWDDALDGEQDDISYSTHKAFSVEKCFVAENKDDGVPDLGKEE